MLVNTILCFQLIQYQQSLRQSACSSVADLGYPDPLQLDGKDLPWVEKADHLGHVIHQATNMEADCKRGRAKFISKSVEIRNQLSFAAPEHILHAIQVLCTDAYGSMLWSLDSDTVESFFKSWNTCVKLVYGVPRNTFTYLVEGYFAADQTSLRNQIMSRYSGFCSKSTRVIPLYILESILQ